MNPLAEKYFQKQVDEIRANRNKLRDFRLDSRKDSLSELLNTTHKEYDTLLQPYEPRSYNLSKGLERIIDLPESVYPQEEARDDLGKELCANFLSEVQTVETYHPLALEWLNRPQNAQILKLLKPVVSALAARLENQIQWHNRLVKQVASSIPEYDRKINKILTHYEKALTVTAYQLYLSQFPNTADRAGIALPREYRLSRKYANQSVGTDLLNTIPEDSQIFKIGIFTGANILKLPLKAAEAETPKQKFGATIAFSVAEVLRLSVPQGKDFISTQYVLPLEKMAYQCYPHIMLTPERFRYKGGIYSKYLSMLETAIDGNAPSVGALCEALPETSEYIAKHVGHYRKDTVVSRFFSPLLNECVENLSQYLAKQMHVKLNKNDNNTANKIRLYAKKEERQQKNDILFNALELDKLDNVTLYVLCADKDTRNLLKTLKAHSDTPLPEESSEPGITCRKVVCSRTDARELCKTTQCISEEHRRSMGILPLRDIALQGIYTTFDKDTLTRSFGWYVDAEEMQAAVAPAVWDVYYHMGAEGALQFPYHHRRGYPGESVSSYNVAYEEKRKGIPITNTRKPAGADMTTGKYKKSMNPDKAGLSIETAKYANNLPYFTVDTISPEFKKLSYKLLVCDYLRDSHKPVTGENIRNYTDLLLKFDAPSEVPDLDKQDRKVIIIEGEKKTLALKGIRDAEYFKALEAFDRTGVLPDKNPKVHMVSLGVGGVWFTKTKSNSLNTDMHQAFNPEGRTVGMCFDKDSAIKPQVAQAFLRAAHAFKEVGAKVECQLLLGPNQIDAHAKGLDDEIDALCKQKMQDGMERSQAIRESYEEYSQIFNRCALPARDDVSYEHESELLAQVDIQAKKRMKAVGIDPERGLQYLPEEIQYAYCSTMIPMQHLMKHLEQERHISEQKHSIAQENFIDL